MDFSTWDSHREDEAILLFETKGKAEHARSGEAYATWTRVYQLSNYFLDLSCLYRNNKAQLVGQLSTYQSFELNRPAKLKLIDTRNQVKDLKLDSGGQFKIEILPDQNYALNVAIENGPNAVVGIPSPISL